jgi:hypothetical protein
VDIRTALLGSVLVVVAACGPPPLRSDIADSAFQVANHHEIECFGSLADALTPFTESMKVRPPTGERGIAEFRVTRRDQLIYVVDAHRWDSGDEGTGFFHERTIVERENTQGAQWCHTRVLYRPTSSLG